MSLVYIRSNRSFLKGLALGLSISMVFIIHDYCRHMLTEVHYNSRKLLTGREADPVVRSSRSSTTKSRNVIDYDLLHKWFDSNSSEDKQHKFEDKKHHHDDDIMARSLYKDVRVACWIMTSPENLMKKAIHVKNTWARRCNIYLFMSSMANTTFPSIDLNVTEGREHLTAKSMRAFKYMYDHHFYDADWFLKADDDTYVILENLRYFLSGENYSQPIYFGQRFKPYVKQGYASGGGGYVLSKEALRRYGTMGFNNSAVCREDKGAEDIEMGKCLQNLGVHLKPSLDALGRTRFHCFPPERFINGLVPKWYHSYNLDGIKAGPENISDYPISFHYVGPQQMNSLEYYTYHLQAYGIINHPQSLNLPH